MKVIDLHCDTTNELRKAAANGGPFNATDNPELHIDLNKLKQGDYLLQCFAAFVDMGRGEDPLLIALEHIDFFYRILHDCHGELAQAKSFEDIVNNQKNGKISAMLTLEDAGCCLGSTAVLRQLYKLGIRIASLTWNYENTLGFPNLTPDFQECGTQFNGLKEKGFEFIAEMEKLGIILDVSHLSDGGFWDVAHASTKPFIASHSNARAISPNLRNLADDMLKALADKGGLTGVNYCALFLDKIQTRGQCKSTIEKVVEHILHIRNVAGIDAVALGSDFDGIGGHPELSDGGKMPLLADALHKAGLPNSEIEKIFHGNILRVMKDILTDHPQNG